MLLSEFLATNDDELEGDEDKELANLNMTQQFLKKRAKLQAAAGPSDKKEVDRKASKNRKIRYIVHDKILNFFTPIDNLDMVEGRDAIVSNLFGAAQKRARHVEHDVNDPVRLL